MSCEVRNLELLSPAATADIAIQAVVHGADAVYIGAPSHGARKSAANSYEAISRVVDFAHQYRANVYVTVNTIVYDDEIRDVERMIWRLWEIGVDALIIQDMGILRMDIPPIALHASTQCDTRTPDKARFLEKCGFSQIVLARELTLGQIRAITSAVSIPVECFVHGALCVSYSGVCQASQCFSGRSANRGACGQLCRLPYDLYDARGELLAKNSHLLSLKDLNLSDRLDLLVDAGVSSFKIEGRLKEEGYVKNTTAYYSSLLDDIVSRSSGRYRRNSIGMSEASFIPSLEKSFNRGFTRGFIDSPRPKAISEPRTPKSQGEPLKNAAQLNPGDGVSWYAKNGEYVGMPVNGVSADGTVSGPQGKKVPKGVALYRTSDLKWNVMMRKQTAVRKIPIDISIDAAGVSATAAASIKVRLPLECVMDKAEKPQDISAQLGKLGATPYKLGHFESRLGASTYIPPSQLASLRRRIVGALDQTVRTTHPIALRRPEITGIPYVESSIDYCTNVANALAESFYRQHGVGKIQYASETQGRDWLRGKPVMTMRHCILREMGLCKKETGHRKIKEPLFLKSGNIRMRAYFDCSDCEMQLIAED